MKVKHFLFRLGIIVNGFLYMIYHRLFNKGKCMGCYKKIIKGNEWCKDCEPNTMPHICQYCSWQCFCTDQPCSCDCQDEDNEFSDNGRYKDEENELNLEQFDCVCGAYVIKNSKIYRIADCVCDSNVY